MSGERKPGWYPHRYEDKGRESYWDGIAWTGESRPRSSGSLRPVPSWLTVGVGVGMLVVFLMAITDNELFGLLVILSLPAWLILDFIPRRGEQFSGRDLLAALVVGLAAFGTVLIGFEYVLDL